MPLREPRCPKTTLLVSECAHCRREDLPAGLAPYWSALPPEPVPGRVVQIEALVPEAPSVGHFPGPVGTLADAYARLFGERAALSRGRSTDNAAGYAASPDPRRAPVRVEVLDLIARIEREVPDLARWVCDACEWICCLGMSSAAAAEGRDGPDEATVAAFSTLAHYWPLLVAYAPETAAAMEARLLRMAGSAERLLGVVPPPALIEAPCPSCGEQSIIRVEDERGNWSAVCTNREDRDPVTDRRRTWDETAWEDAHPRTP